jgi:hypothetical protein
VQRTKDSEQAALWRTLGGGTCANQHCSATDFEYVVGKQLIAGLQVQQLAQKIVMKNATKIPGPVKYNIVRFPVNKALGKFEDVNHPNRDIKAALERLAKGEPLPKDVNDREHFNDGSRHRGDCLPIRNVKDTTTYYREYGILSSSRGWEKNLGSERLITGACGEIYYSSYHYQTDWWWVFSPFNGTWRKFKCRPL